MRGSMAGNKRGFTRERHAGTKVAVSVLTVAGFGVAWAGFARSHAESATAPVSDPTPEAAVAATPATGVTPAPAATATRARRSRGS